MKLDYELLREMMPVTAELGESGCDGADNILVRLDTVELDIANINQTEELVATYGVVLFPEQFGGDYVVATRIQFDDSSLATLVYEMTDNNYAALGVTFDGVLPVALHYNDRSYPVGLIDDYTNLPALLSRILEVLSVRWAGDTSKDWDDYAPFKGTDIWPPIVSPRLGLTQADAPGEYAIMMAIRALLRVYSPTTEDHLFNSEVSGYDIAKPTFVLRTYDRHSSDYSHTWNFVWRDFAVQWYGRFDRDPTFNRHLTSDEVVVLMDELTTAFKSHTNWPPEPKPAEPMTQERLQRLNDKLRRNGRSGGF